MTEPNLSSPQTEKVTVVIPGRNCSSTLPHCLEALIALKNAREIEEVIFVNDASTDESAQLAQKAGVRVLDSPGLGPGGARNLGWRAARTPLIWFVDADCVPEGDALALLLAIRREQGAQAVGGSYANAQESALVARLIHAEMVVRHKAIGKVSNFAITANLLCEKSVLDQLGGFDEAFKLAQDLDLAYRIVDAGHLLGFEANSRVAHFHETKFLSYLTKQARQGYWRMRLYEKHPGRARGDKYSGLVDYAQPPMAMMVVGCTLGAGTAAALKLPVSTLILSLAAGGGALVLLGLQIPMSYRISRLEPSTGLAYIPFGALRAAARGLGMCVSVGELIKRSLSR